MENKLYKVHACGHFVRGEVHECFIIAPDDVSAMKYATMFNENFKDKLLLAEKYDISLLTGYVLSEETASWECNKTPCYSESEKLKMRYEFV